MTESEREETIRRHAAGEMMSRAPCESAASTVSSMSWAGLGALGLRQPVAPMEGPNVEARQRPSALIREPRKAKA